MTEPQNKPKSHSLGFVALLLLLCVSSSAAEEISLENALGLFYENNYDIIVSKYEVDRAYADYVTARLRPNPSLTVNYNNLAMSQGRTNRWDNTQLSVRIDQLIETAGKRTLRTSYAGESLEVSKLTHRDVIRTLLIGFYTTYYNLHLDMANLDFARSEMARFDKVIDVAKRRHDAGFVSLIDYTKLKLARIELENNLTSLATQLSNDIESFNFLLGSTAGYAPGKHEIQEDFRDYDVSELSERAYEHRYDYLSAQKQVRALDYSLALAKAYRVPDVSVGGEWDSTGNPATNGIGMGFSVPIPLFNRYQGEILKRTAEHKQAEVQVARVKGRITTELNQALNSYRAAVFIFSSYKTKKDEMEGLLANTEKAFSLGGITVLELLDTRRTFRDYMTKFNQTFTQATLDKELLKVYTGEIK